MNQSSWFIIAQRGVGQPQEQMLKALFRARRAYWNGLVLKRRWRHARSAIEIAVAAAP
jgi:hypothetical protein